MRILGLTTGVFLFAGCLMSSAPEPADNTTPLASSKLTTEACEAQNGQVIGDAGDGAVHRPEYRCPGNGTAPIGTVVFEMDEPTPTEGAVCCKK